MRSFALVVLCSALFAAQPACAGRSHADPAALRDGGPLTVAEAPVTLAVDNRNWSDVVLFAVVDGTRNRLGMVVAATKKQFQLSPSHMSQSGDLYLIADPIGDTRTFASERIQVQPGQMIEWTLESDLARSSLLIR